MKVITVLGTRPEIIRLSSIIPKLDNICEHVLVHTGQSYDYNLSQVFFDELRVRKPDHFLEVKSDTFAEQIGKILVASEEVFLKENPDKLLILGDTNSALSAIVAKRLGILVYHMEAGNRCFDDKVPEEVNRRIIDHSSDIHIPYNERSRANLLREGIASNRIFVTGNPIYEVIQNNMSRSNILDLLHLVKDNYYLATAHRQENVDNRDRLESILFACSQLAQEKPVIFSLYPRTKEKIEKFKLEYPSITFHEPFSFSDFQMLERHALCVITDSGTVQEECCIFDTRCVTIRDTTERPETIESGNNIISGLNHKTIINCVEQALKNNGITAAPDEYTVPNVSDKVINLLVGAY